MLLLEELTQLRETQLFIESLDHQLFEALGKLGVIDRNLLRILKGTRYYSGKQNRIRDALGQNSDVLTKRAVSHNKAWDEFDDPKAVAMVIKVGDDQVFAVIDEHRGDLTAPGYGKHTDYNIIANPDLFKLVDPKEYVNTINSSAHGWASNDYRVDALRSQKTQAISRIKKVMKQIFDAAKKNGQDVNVMIVDRDEQRLKTRAERAEGRKGIELKTTGNRQSVRGGREYAVSQHELNKINERVAKSLRQRLDDYKSSKADKFNSPEEMLASLIKDGLFEKFTIGDGEYDLTNERLYVRDLLKRAKAKADGKEPRDGPGYLEFSLRDRFSRDRKSNYYEAWEAAKEKFKDVENQERRDDAISREMMKHGFMPGKLKVVLDLEGGKIVPSEVLAAHW